MSWFSKTILDPIEAMFTKAATSGGVASVAPTETVTTAISTATTALSSIVPSLADVGVNAVLSLVPEGPAFDGLADELIDAVIAGLQAKKTTPTPAPE